jgi:hypothetical protein
MTTEYKMAMISFQKSLKRDFFSNLVNSRDFQENLKMVASFFLLKFMYSKFLKFFLFYLFWPITEAKF